MTAPTCVVRTCHRPATWRLEAVHERRGTRVLLACGRHVDGLSIRLEADIGTPSCWPVTSGPAKARDEQLEIGDAP